MSENPVSTQWDLAEFDNRERWRTRPPEEFPAKWACEWGFDEYGLWQTFDIAGVKYKMRYIPPGSFLMGSPEDEYQREESEQQHQVILTKGFWLGEVTVSQILWVKVMGRSSSLEKLVIDEDLPVDSVSWEDCHSFCKKLSDITEANFQLPSEAQWEYACRAGTVTPFNTGEQLTTDQANYRGDWPYGGNFPLSKEQVKKQTIQKKAISIHQYPPNNWGLKQMHGNVWEWCLDGHRKYGSELLKDPLGNMGKGIKGIRGGRWYNGAKACRSAFRNWREQDHKAPGIGFRVSSNDSIIKIVTKTI